MTQQVRLPPGFVMMDGQPAQPQPAVPTLPPGFVMLDDQQSGGGVLESMGQSSPSITGQGANPEPRFGDFFKPMVGGRNPIAEGYDTFVKPLTDISSDRPIIDRFQDTVNFAVSAPLQALRLPSIGQMVEDVTGNDAIAASEQRFVENNPKLLNTLGAVGEVAAGGAPMGQGFRPPAVTRAPDPVPSRQPARPVPENVTRARAAVEDMEQIGVTPYAPAVSMARRGDNSIGALSQTLQDKPFVGAPLQRGARQFVDEMVQSQDRIREGYGTSRTMQGGGGQVRANLDEFKNGTRITGGTVRDLDDAALDQLARSPPRLTTFKDVQGAKYERAERAIPEDKAGAKPVKKGEKRDTAGLARTRGILVDIKRRYGLTINKSEAARARKGDPDGLSLDNAPDFENPKWTGSANVDRSLDAIASAKGNWRVGLEGMREIRSNIRRVLSAKGDTEVNALARGDLKRLYKAISDDMDAHLERLANTAETPELQARFAQAREFYKDADTFTARYSETLRELEGLFKVKSDEAMASSVLTAMKDGGKGNLRKLLELRRVAPKEVIDEIASAVIVELGRPTGRAGATTQEAGFSPSRFASQWNNLNDKARKAMFGHRPQLFNALNRFARVSQNMADFEALANNSRTGVSNAVWATIGAGGVGVASISPETIAAVAGAMMTGRAASAFLASPAYVNWLTRAGTLSQGGSPQAIATHLKQLRRIALGDKSLDPVALQAIGLGAGNVGDQE